LNWLELNNKTELDKLTGQGSGISNQYLIFFKHSTRCGTSMIAKREFEKYWKNDSPVYLINVVENREISNAIEHLFGVKHESPQLLLVKDGKCVYNESHYGIDALDVMEFMSSN
jgi:bacillithiol system protein YtxJ